MSNRTFWAVQAVGINPLGSAANPPVVHGLQSAGITTTFNLEQVFEIGQIAVYENIEDIPDVELTLEKVVDGYPLIYHLGTRGYTTGSLTGRSNQRCTAYLNIYGDTQDSASGVATNSVELSGLYVSSSAFNIPVDGNMTESATFVGNNKVWSTSSFTMTGELFNNADSPLAETSSWGGVQRRENVVWPGVLGAYAATNDVNGQVDSQYSLSDFNASNPAGTILPDEIPGISTSGTNDRSGSPLAFGAHIQSVSVSTDLGRDALLELGRKAPYFRFVNFPIEVTCDIEITATNGDGIDALEESENLTNQTIKIGLREGTFIDLGTKNKLSNVTYGGADAGGGNATVTYSYSTFNDYTVSHPQDPT